MKTEYLYGEFRDGVTPGKSEVILRLNLEKAAWVCLLILAVVMRFYGLGDRVISHDESLTPIIHGNSQRVVASNIRR